MDKTMDYIFRDIGLENGLITKKFMDINYLCSQSGNMKIFLTHFKSSVPRNIHNNASRSLRKIKKIMNKISKTKKCFHT